MNEQELRQEFKNHSDCYSDAFEVIQAMTEDAAIALAKAYADAREKEKDAEIERLKHAVKLWESLRDDAIDANSQLQVHNQRILDYVKSIRSKIQHGTATLYEIATIVEAAIINQ